MRKAFFIVVCLVLITWGCFDLATRQKPPEPVVVEAPVSVSSRVVPEDSAYLMITLEKKNYAVTLLGKSFTTGKLDSLKNFLEQNQATIDKEKVMVIIKNGASYTMDSSVIQLLRKIDVTKFKLVNN